VRRYSHLHPATRNTFFIVFYSIIRWRLGVAKHLERFLQKTRKTLPMQGIGMSVSCGIPEKNMEARPSETRIQMVRLQVFNHTPREDCGKM
jgi:hypothetical protein